MICYDFFELEELWKKTLTFKGVICTEAPEREWEIEVQLRKNTAYF